jgi:hypothetical protein
MNNTASRSRRMGYTRGSIGRDDRQNGGQFMKILCMTTGKSYGIEE